MKHYPLVKQRLFFSVVRRFKEIQCKEKFYLALFWRRTLEAVLLKSDSTKKNSVFFERCIAYTYRVLEFGIGQKETWYSLYIFYHIQIHTDHKRKVQRMFSGGSGIPMAVIGLSRGHVQGARPLLHANIIFKFMKGTQANTTGFLPLLRDWRGKKWGSRGAEE